MILLGEVENVAKVLVVEIVVITARNEG